MSWVHKAPNRRDAGLEEGRIQDKQAGFSMPPGTIVHPDSYGYRRWASGTRAPAGSIGEATEVVDASATSGASNDLSIEQRRPSMLNNFVGSIARRNQVGPGGDAACLTKNNQESLAS